MKEYVILVDERDRAIGQAEKIQAHQDGALHRAFSVFITRNTGEDLEILMQQRAASKYHCGGLWTNTCCGHPRPSEETVAAAERRLHEEMNLNCELTEVGQFTYQAPFENGLVEHEIDHVMVGTTTVADIQPNPEEASDWQWMSLTALDHALNTTPKEFTPWLAEALRTLQAAGDS